MRRSAVVAMSALLLLWAWACGHAQEAETTWVYEATGSSDPEVTLVDDPDALDGKALECPTSGKTWSGWPTFTSGYTMEYLPGEYEARFRLKVEDNTGRDLLFDLGVENGGVWEHPRGTDFRESGEYQEFVYPFTIQTPVLNICVVRKLAGHPAWIDRVMVIRKRLYTELEQLTFAKFERPDNPKLLLHEGTRVWFVKGLYYQHYRLHTLLQRMGAMVDYAYVVRGQRGSGLAGVPLQGQQAEEKRPDTLAGEEEGLTPPLRSRPYDTVLGYDLVVLGDTDAECLTVAQRAMIHDFVKAGGGLLVVGGPFASGRGALDRSDLLAPLLPVTIPGSYDLKPLLAPAPLQPGPGSVPKQGLAWGRDPLVLWMHQAKPKPGATVEMTAGGQPALVVWEFGKGRVAALTITVLGEPPAGATAFWNWSDWPRLMTNVVQWLLPRQ